MELRCREGELALVIREEPGCECNIGRAVRVQGPIIDQPGYGSTWLIEPLEPAPWTLRTFCGELWTGPVMYDSHIEHPDAWLLPLRPGDEIEWLAQTETLQRLIKLGEGKLVDLQTFLKAVTCDDLAEAELPFDMDAATWQVICSDWQRITNGGVNLAPLFRRQHRWDIVMAYKQVEEHLGMAPASPAQPTDDRPAPRKGLVPPPACGREGGPAI